MFENCLRFVTDQPITVGELETLARTRTNLDGMRRWGYITIDGAAAKTYHGRPGPAPSCAPPPAGCRPGRYGCRCRAWSSSAGAIVTAVAGSTGCAARWR